MLKREDTWAIILGATLLVFGLVTYFTAAPADLAEQHQIYHEVIETESTAPFKTVEYYDAKSQKANLKVANEAFPKTLKKLTGKPATWNENPLTSFYLDLSATDKSNVAALRTKATELKLQAIDNQRTAQEGQYENESFNTEATAAIAAWQKAESLAKKAADKTKSYNKIGHLLLWFIILGSLFGLAAYFLQGQFFPFLKGFAYVFLFGVISYWLAANGTMKTYGIGYAAWAIVLGLLISNTIGTPRWVEPALQTPLYIKTGLVLLGAEVLFNKVLAIGLPGIFVAWIVTPIVLVSTYWFGQKILKIPSKTLNMVVSADMSVCGVSAAVATAAACKAPKEELTLAIGLSMVFTSVMMIVLPAFINAVGIPEVLGGAWIGGTIDATGAVVAAGAFLGDKALNVAATIKMIQNILIGVIAFGVAVYFSTKVENGGGAKVGISEIWKRFPKFILGFIGASIVFSTIYASIGDDLAYSIIDQGVIRGFTKNVRGWLFCLAFVSIGLSTNFSLLRSHFRGGKPLILYLCGQTLNLVLTLLMAYLMFYKVFPEVTAGI
ncbi:MAG: YeiH family protein [Saprospiraceae bacterium]